MAKRKRRAFTDEFKAETVRLIRESRKSIAVVARELGLTESAVRAWVRQAGIDAAGGRPDDRGARGTRPLAARDPDGADGARHPKKSDGGFNR
jgi:transposase-like protein